MDPKTPPPPAPNRKTVLKSTASEGGCIVTLSYDPDANDPWATHLLRVRDGQKVRGTYMNHWPDAFENFVQRCGIEGVVPDFSFSDVTMVAECAAALADGAVSDRNRWDGIYSYLQHFGNGFPGLWSLCANVALIGEAEFGHLWESGDVEFIDVASSVVDELATWCRQTKVAVQRHDIMAAWQRAIATERERWKSLRRRWPNWGEMEDAIHNNEAYASYPAFFGLRRVMLTGNPSGLVHYVDADMIQRMMISTSGRFVDSMERKWGFPIFEQADPEREGNYYYLDGPEFWDESSEAIDGV